MNIPEPNLNWYNRKILAFGILTLAMLIGAIGHIQSHWVRADDVIPLPEVTEADGSMGTCYSFYQVPGSSESLAAKAYAAGSRWDRFDFRWNQIESEPGVFNFGSHEQLVDRDRSNGIEVVAILGSTAQWASRYCTPTVQQAQTMPLLYGHPPLPQSKEDDLWWRPCPPANLNLPWDHPENYWGRYVHQTATHFKDKVKAWEIWNEPDLPQFWIGSPAEYARLLQVAYRAVKAVDPDATVLFGGIAYWGDRDFYKQTFQELQALDNAPENGGYFDVLSLHLYSNVYQLGMIAAEIQTNMNATVGPHPIWLTETGVPIWGESQQPERYVNAATAVEAAAFIIESYAGARAAGIEKFFVFRAHDEMMNQAFGLIRNDLSLRPGYVAYQVAARYLNGENQITGPFSNGKVHRITFWGTPRGRIDVLWNETGGEILQHQHPAVIPAATLIDHRGQEQNLIAVGDTYTIPLQPATANTGYWGEYIIGGPPVLLIQPDPTPPTSTLRPLPDVATTTALTLTWDVTDTLSGYWYAQIEQAPAPDGPWTLIADWSETQAVTQTVVSLPSDQETYFRARARDNVGNWEPWPATAETSTSIYLTRTVYISVTTYLDNNGNNTWDADEVTPLTPPSISWRSPDDAVITETNEVSWSIVQAVNTGVHTLKTRLPHHLPDHTLLTVAAEPPTQFFTVTVGLKPIRAQSFLPTVARNAAP